MAANEIFNDLNLVLQLNQHIQGVSVSSNGARLLASARSSSPSGPLAKQTSFKVLTNLESIRYSESRQDAQFDHQRSIFLSVSSSDLPFHLQGDKDFNEASALAKRRALRYSEAIKTRIEFLWGVAGGKKQAEMAQRIRQQQREDGGPQGRSRRVQQSVRRVTASNDMTPPLLPPLEELEEEDYMELMLLIFKVLRGDFVLELAHKQIQCDWEVDSHHGKSLSFEQFFAAVFELVDVWTCDIEEATYERFLHLLARRITRRVAVFLDGAELKLSLSDNFEPQVVVKSIPLRTIPKFVTIARVVAATGMTTVGELARADPNVVERKRIDFLERNTGKVVDPGGLSETRKLGQDLQTLLAMFKSIALQFENINYALDNNVLRRLPSAAGARLQPGDSRKATCESSTGTGTALTGQSHSNGDIDTEGDIRAVPVGKSPKSGSLPNIHSKSDAETRQAQATVGGHTNHSAARDRNISAETSQGSKRNVSQTESNSNLHSQSQTKARDSSSGCFQPINTIYELQTADAGIVNTLRSTFLIEKAISIERQTELPAIRNELVKFGVPIDAESLADEPARDRYNALYDLLVLRDGESLKTLAAVMLEQIKLELSIHGIIVDDEEDVEEVYDGFFATVVTGTGESIVQDAQRWMESTVHGNKVNDYIQHDFHELESIEQVKLLGTKHGDEEFLALLAKTSEREGENTSKLVGKTNTSPIQRKPSRAIAVSMSHADTCQKIQSRASGPVEEFLPNTPIDQVVVPINEQQDHDPSEKRKKTKKKKNDQERPSHSSSSAQYPPASVEDGTSSRGSHHNVKSVITDRKAKFTISTQGNEQTDALENKVAEERIIHGPSIEATCASALDNAKRNRPTLISRHGLLITGLDMDAALDEKNHHDTSEQHTARDALNVAIELEEEDTVQSSAGARDDGERLISMEPKVPKIVIGGATSAKNVPVTGRYIQLLGLGTVLITNGEHDFFQLLRSHEGLDTDLVCFDIGAELDTALTKLHIIQQRVGNRVILFGGNPDESDKTQQVALECLTHGALYFATIPFDFPRLREKIMSFFENAKQPYILRQRKPPGQTAQIGSSIGTGSLFAMHDEPRKVSTSVAFAKTPRRKLSVAIPALPSLSYSPRESPQLLPQGSNESRRADFTPVAPSTPRSSQSRNRSPRFSTSLNKLIR